VTVRQGTKRVPERRILVRPLLRGTLPDLLVGHPLLAHADAARGHVRVQPGGREDHRLVAGHLEHLSHNLTYLLQHVILHAVPDGLVEHLQVRVLDVWRDHGHLNVRQCRRGVHHGVQDRLSEGNHRPRLRHKVAGIVAQRGPVVIGGVRIEAVDGGDAHQSGTPLDGQLLDGLSKVHGWRSRAHFTLLWSCAVRRSEPGRRLDQGSISATRCLLRCNSFTAASWSPRAVSARERRETV